jgi:hypothetical protein
MNVYNGGVCESVGIISSGGVESARGSFACPLPDESVLLPGCTYGLSWM